MSRDSENVYAPLFHRVYEIAKELDEHQRCSLLMACCAHAFGDEIPDMDGLTRAIYEQVAAPSIDKTIEKSEKNRRNRNKRESSNNEPATNALPTDNEPITTALPTNNEPATKEAKKNEERRTTYEVTKTLTPNGPAGGGAGGGEFYRPSIDEWVGQWAKSAERSHIVFDASEESQARNAFDHYERNGWETNKHRAIENWRRALATCFYRHHPTPKGPSLDDVIGYIGECAEETGVPVTERDARQFHSHFEGMGWVVGSTRIADWRAKFRAWMLDERRAARASPKPSPPKTQWDIEHEAALRAFDENAEVIRVEV